MTDVTLSALHSPGARQYIHFNDTLLHIHRNFIACDENIVFESSDIISCYLYEDKLYDKHYLFVLRKDEIILLDTNDNFNVIDTAVICWKRLSINSDIKWYSGAQLRLFLSVLCDGSIFFISFKRINSNTNFIKFAKIFSIPEISSCSPYIIDASLSTIENFEDGREIDTVTVLYKDGFKSVSVLAVRQKLTLKGTSNDKWEVIHDFRDIFKLTDTYFKRSNFIKNNLTWIYSVSDLGTFIFNVIPKTHSNIGKLETYFLDFPDCQDVYIKNKLMSNKYYQSFDLPTNFNINKISNIIYHTFENGNTHIFSIPLYISNSHITITFENITYDSENLISYWNGFFCDFIIPDDDILSQSDQYKKIWHNINNNMLAIDTNQQLKNVNFISKNPEINIISQNINSNDILSSIIVEKNLRKLVSIGSYSDNSGLIITSYYALTNFFKSIELKYYSNDLLKKFSCNDIKEFYISNLKNSNDYELIACKDEFSLISSTGSPYPYGTFISPLGETISIKDTQKISFSHCEDNNSQNYAYILKSGYLCWSNSNDKIQLPHFENFAIADYQLTYLHNSTTDTYITYISTDTKIFVYDSKTSLLKDITLDLDFPSSFSIYRILALQFDKSIPTLLISDIEGFLWEINIESNSVKSKIKVTEKGFELYHIPNTKDVLLYNYDSLILFKNNGSDNEFQRIECPLSIKYISGMDLKCIFILDIDNNVHKILLNDKDDNIEPELISKTIKLTDSCPRKLHISNCSQRFIITTSITRKEQNIIFNENYESCITSSKLYVIDLHLNKIASSYDLTKNFSKSSIVSIANAPSRTKFISKEKNNHNIHFAKSLIFEKCFLVALEYEEYDVSNSKNLLLFSIDNQTGHIDLQNSKYIDSEIKCLHNFQDEYLLICGNTLQALSLNYSIKEGMFHYTPKSNILELPRGVYELKDIAEFGLSEVPVKRSKNRNKMKKVVQPIGKLLLLTTSRGSYEISIFPDLKPNDGNSDFLKFAPIPFSQRNSLIDYTFRAVSHFTRMKINDQLWFCLRHSDRIVYCQTEDDSLQFEFQFDDDVTDIFASRCDESNHEIKPVTNNIFSDMFIVSTKNSGLYVVGFLKDKLILKSYKRKLSNKMKQASNSTEDLESDYDPYLDERVLHLLDKQAVAWNFLHF